MEVQERVRHYLGKEWGAPVVVKYGSLPEGERPLTYCYNRYVDKPFPPGKTTYYQDMTRSIHYLPQLYKTTFLFYPHDRAEGFGVPTLVKSRPIYGYGHSVLFNLNYLRHFWDVYKVEDKDIPYEEKKDVLVWRGADTGYGFGNNIPYRPVSRQTLVETYTRHPDPKIDVGLSNIMVNHTGDEKKAFQQYVKPKMNMQELLRHKFLLSVEGNDVATNLKWVLNSNSVAFCPPFTINSWILEENLRPWVHYIPVRHDFQDLPEKVDWATHHPTQCKDISRQANAYIRQFMDMKKEKLVLDTLLQEYSQNIKVMD